ncbi:hypothetical protein GGI1_15638, partial [Acidithiobacillus sp. GGI-221]
CHLPDVTEGRRAVVIGPERNLLDIRNERYHLPMFSMAAPRSRGIGHHRAEWQRGFLEDATRAWLHHEKLFGQGPGMNDSEIQELEASDASVADGGGKEKGHQETGGSERKLAAPGPQRTE